jgi:hypothetical protein
MQACNTHACGLSLAYVERKIIVDDRCEDRASIDRSLPATQRELPSAHGCVVKHRRSNRSGTHTPRRRADDPIRWEPHLIADDLNAVVLDQILRETVPGNDAHLPLQLALGLR